MDETQNETPETYPSHTQHVVFFASVFAGAAIAGAGFIAGGEMALAVKDKIKKFRKDRSEKKLTLVKD